MKKLVAQLNDGSYINIPADRMELEENCIIVSNAGEMIAVLDVSVVLFAYLSEKAVTK